MNYRGSSHLLGVDLGNDNYNYFFQQAEESFSTAQCFPLITFLRALNVTQVDLLSLDLQGADKMVLRTLPWDDLTIRVIVVELTQKDSDQDFQDFLKMKGYLLINNPQKDFVEDHIYVKKGEVLLDNLR